MWETVVQLLALLRLVAKGRILRKEAIHCSPPPVWDMRKQLEWETLV
jgi:hypothetical protein